MSPAKNTQYPHFAYHQGGKSRRINSPEEEPQEAGWRETPWPAKPASREQDVNAMPPDMAIAHLKDALSESQGEVRGLKADKDFQERQFSLKYGARGEELAEATAKVGELLNLLTQAEARIVEFEKAAVAKALEAKPAKPAKPATE